MTPLSFVGTGTRQIPGRAIWQPYANEEYLVFFDESFYQFFDFTRRDGNFVHGAVGLPASQYESFKEAFSSPVADYARAFQKAKGVAPKELKSADTYKLGYGVRRRLVVELRKALAAHGGFVGGFYTSNCGYVMEKIREDLVGQGGFTAIPEDYAQLYDAKAKEINDSATGPGKSSVISDLLTLPVMALSYFFSDLGCPYSVTCDPRQADEDFSVRSQIEAVMNQLHTAETLGLKSTFLGLKNETNSQDELGLQVADIVAGEVRRFFRFNPGLRRSESSLDLVTFNIQDGEATLLDEVGGRLMKKGRQLPIPLGILKKAARPLDRCAFPYLSDLLASGLVTCVTDFGTQRDINLHGGTFWDLCD